MWFRFISDMILSPSAMTSSATCGNTDLGGFLWGLIEVMPLGYLTRDLSSFSELLWGFQHWYLSRSYRPLSRSLRAKFLMWFWIRRQLGVLCPLRFTYSFTSLTHSLSFSDFKVPVWAVLPPEITCAFYLSLGESRHPFKGWRRSSNS